MTEKERVKLVLAAYNAAVTQARRDYIEKISQAWTVHPGEREQAAYDAVVAQARAAYGASLDKAREIYEKALTEIKDGGRK